MTFLQVDVRPKQRYSDVACLPRKPPAPPAQRSDGDFDDEIRAHLELEADRLIADGVSPEDARAAARRTFGNVATVREGFHDARRCVWLDQFAQDLRYGCRTLLRSPGFAVTTILTLGVGLSLVTVVFSIFNAYVLRPFAVPDPYSLYEIRWRSQDDGGRTFTWRTYEDVRGQRDLFEAVGEHTRFVTSAGRQIAAGLVADNYFQAIGARVRVGRTLSEFDVRTPGGDRVAVLSDQGWARLFDRDPGVLGRTVELNGHTFEVVGVMRPEFSGLDESPRDLWAPITMYTALTGEDLTAPASPRRIGIVLRVKPGVSVEQIQAALVPIVERMSTVTQPVRVEVNLRATPNLLSLELMAILSPVFAAFGLVLVAACTNVSNVMLARASARQREIGVRLSVGASRSRVVRQLLTEGLVISLAAGVLGLTLARIVLNVGPVLFVASLPPVVSGMARVAPLDFDGRVFLFALILAAGTTLLFALLPALQATRIALTSALRGEVAEGVRSSTLRRLLVTSQIAVSLILLVAAATLIRNGMTLGKMDLGLAIEGAVSVNVRGESNAFVPRAVDVLATAPGIELVAVTSGNPLFERKRTVAAGPAEGSTRAATRYTFVSPEYFSILQIPIARGRGFRSEEAAGSARVAIVSAATARAFWPDEDPIGKLITIDRRRLQDRTVIAGGTTKVDGRPPDDLADYPSVVVIGVTPDVVSGFVFDGPDAGHMYLPINPRSQAASAIMLRGRSPADAKVDRLQGLLRQVHPDPIAFEAVTLEDVLALQMYPLRVASWIGSLLAALALALSVSGLYGVLAYTLGQRTREIGIRIALGATPQAVVGLVVRQSGRLVALGAAIGGVIAFAALRILSSALEFRGVALVDTGAFAIGVLLVSVAAAVAAYYPARRATRVDPSETLRADA